jgi:hypothetical protein
MRRIIEAIARTLICRRNAGRERTPSFETNTKSTWTCASSFHGSTSQAIVIYMPKNGCLRVLDPGVMELRMRDNPGFW